MAVQILIPAQMVLAVLPVGEDRKMLEDIFGQSNWKVRFAKDFQEAQDELRTSPLAVVISDGCFPGGNWKDLLFVLQEMPHPKPLIVADRLADDRLWAEVLNLGAYDLLIKPFDTQEVLRTVGLACKTGQNHSAGAG
jgi:DNA-binding NtrC family response regulator